MSVLFITHNLGVVAQIADRVAVMYAGRIVEQGDVVTVFASPATSVYTRLAAQHPSRGGRGPRSGAAAAVDSRAGAEPFRVAAGLQLSRRAAPWRMTDAAARCRRSPRCCRAMTSAAITGRSPDEHGAGRGNRSDRELPNRGRAAAPRQHHVARGGSAEPVDRPGRGGGAGGRVGQRKDHRGARHPAVAGAHRRIDTVRGDRHHASGQAGAAPAAPAHADDLSGPLLQPEPAPEGARHRRGGLRHPWHRHQAAIGTSGPSSCWTASGCRRMRWSATRTNSPADSASASASPARWRSSRCSWWPTSRSRRWTCRCRRRC